MTVNNNYAGFWGLINEGIFKRLDAECDIIRLITDELFMEIVEKSSMGQKRLKDVSDIKFPYGHFMNKTLAPSVPLRHKIAHFVKESTHRARWISISARGALDPSGIFTKKAIECALKMVDLRLVTYIFFASESKRLYDMVEVLVPAQTLITVEKKYANDSLGDLLDTADHGEHWFTALEDWFLVGEAGLSSHETHYTLCLLIVFSILKTPFIDYCATSTPKSEYSTTSAMRTGCRYIRMDDNDCSKPPDPNVLHPKVQ